MVWHAQLPGSIFADECVGEDNELSGDGDESEFWRFSSGPETLIEGLHISVKACGAEGCEIEDAAHGWASAPDDANAVTFARLICNRGNAGQHADLLGRGAADLGQAGDEGGGGREPEARDRGQDGIAPGQAVVC